MSLPNYTLPPSANTGHASAATRAPGVPVLRGTLFVRARAAALETPEAG